MALIKCADCGNDISDQAERCLYCGRPKESTITTNNMTKKVAKIGVGFASVAIIFISITMFVIMLALRMPLPGILIALVAYFGLRFLWKFVNNL